jgi:hypothetical protein
MDGISANIENSIDRFDIVTLDEMDAVKLMNRTDTKYIFHTGQLAGILDKARDLYRVLTINERKVFAYNSLYYDTPGLRTYLDHHNGIRPRFKVRFREYVDTGGIYLEVKRKIANDRTRKSRTKTERIEFELSNTSMEYISKRSPLDPAELQPALWTIFRRITLVGRGSPERITIDIDLKFRRNGFEDTLPYLTIAEVKRAQAAGSTQFMRILKGAQIYPASSSKYCLGTIMLNDKVKFNRFKATIREIKKIENAYRLSSPTG